MKQLMELFWAFFRIGSFTFGGGMAMLPMLKREVVVKYGWSTEEELLDIYAIGQCTPGIIAVNTATYIGYQQKGLLGSIFGTLGMVTPSIIIISLIATILRNFIDLPFVLHALSGIQIVVCALMLQTVYSLAKAGIKNKLGLFLFLAGFLIATFTPVPTILLVLFAAIVGIITYTKKKGDA